VPPEEREKAKAEFASTRREAAVPSHSESTLLGKDGRRWRIAWENTTWRDSEGRIAGFSGVGRDVTVLKALETQALHAQKLDGIKRSVARMVHDFGSLLTIISGSSQILIQSKTEEDKEYTLLREIKNAAQAATALNGQLLAFTSQQTLSPKLLDLNAVIEAVGRKVESLLPSNIALQLELEPELAKVRADSAQLVGVLLSLANNAMEAMPEGGRLAIHSENVEVDEALAESLPGVPPGQFVMVAVADTGIGMSEEVQAHLFEPFFSTKSSARGLGLPAIYGIIQQSGGHIVVESKPGGGSTFRIYLPRAGGER
jgi:two-component system, cell cycle sensor histidine kinase and response regulator CckA